MSFSKRISGTTPYYNLIRRLVFPSTRAIVIASLILATGGVGFSFLIAERSWSFFFLGATFGILTLIVPSFISDLVLYSAVMRGDPLFYPRRCFALSLFTMGLWVLVFFLGSILTLFVPEFVFPDSPFLIALFVVVPIRALGVFSMSRQGFGRRVLFTIVGPTLTSLSAAFIFGISLGRIMTALMLSSIAGLTFSFALISLVELYGRKVIRFSPIRMFRAFLLDWLEGENEELESYLSELGVESEIDVAVFIFRQKGRAHVKGVMLVSNFHPGPFLNIGSSVFPFLFQRVVKNRFNAVGFVPHGVSGHELNLVSQEENARIISWFLSSSEDATYHSKATPVIRASNEIATAICQVFDGCALVAMTTSPNDMEDVPSEVANKLARLTQGSFRHVALIDAHNCLNAPTIMTSRKIGALEEAALSTLQSSVEEAGRPFKVGVAERTPNGVALKTGMGPGGISVLCTEVDGQRFAYINIDGNNMIGGLREDILDAVRQLGFHDAEVMTTDTHMVNGIVSARLGYHPIGEAIPKASLLKEIISACSEAANDLELSEVAVLHDQISVTTLGSKSLKRVMNLVYKISNITAVTLFPMLVGVAAVSLLFLV